MDRNSMLISQEQIVESVLAMEPEIGVGFLQSLCSIVRDKLMAESERALSAGKELSHWAEKIPMPGIPVEFHDRPESPEVYSHRPLSRY